jgi:hypothetical protein
MKKMYLADYGGNLVENRGERLSSLWLRSMTAVTP